MPSNSLLIAHLCSSNSRRSFAHFCAHFWNSSFFCNFVNFICDRKKSRLFSPFREFFVCFTKFSSCLLVFHLPLQFCQFFTFFHHIFSSVLDFFAIFSYYVYRKKKFSSKKKIIIQKIYRIPICMVMKPWILFQPN